jgi:hypothetical protein
MARAVRTPAAWWRSCKRRQPGIYAYRTRRHLRPATEWGYVGKSRHLPSRHLDHLGQGRYGHAAKPWADLIVARYTLTLPWWLGWDWLTLSLETLAILVLRPRYNWAKNPRLSKVGPVHQARQRETRDRNLDGCRAAIEAARLGTLVIRWAGALTILIGLGGYLWTR